MRVDLPSGTPAALALPDGAAGRGVVVIPDIMGLRPLFEDLIGRLAGEHGWAVAAFEPFPGRDLPTIDDRFAAIPELQDVRVDEDAVAAADLARDRAGVDRVAVIGFCMGGMYAYKAAATGRFDRAVSFYGMIKLPAAWRGTGQREPLDVLARAGIPVLSIVGEQDPYTPPEDVADLTARLGASVTVVRYADAEHGFVHDPSRPAHRPDDAADAWQKVAAFLA